MSLPSQFCCRFGFVTALALSSSQSHCRLGFVGVSVQLASRSIAVLVLLSFEVRRRLSNVTVWSRRRLGLVAISDFSLSGSCCCLSFVAVWISSLSRHRRHLILVVILILPLSGTRRRFHFGVISLSSPFWFHRVLGFGSVLIFSLRHRFGIVTASVSSALRSRPLFGLRNLLPTRARIWRIASRASWNFDCKVESISCSDTLMACARVYSF